MRLVRFFAAAPLILISSLASARITTASYLLDYSSALSQRVDYGRVDIVADDTTGVVQFTVNALSTSAYSAVGADFGIDRFGFNVTNITSGVDQWRVRRPIGWQLTARSDIGKFGTFVELYRAGRGLPMSSLTFYLDLANPSEAIASSFTTLSSGSAAGGNQLFAARVSGFDTLAGIREHFIGGSTPISAAPVPAPGATSLGVIGLSSLALIRRSLS